MARAQKKSPEPWQDPIVAEVRQAREALFAAAGYDLDVFCEQLRARQQAEGRQGIRRAPRRIQPAPAQPTAGRPNKRLQPAARVRRG